MHERHIRRATAVALAAMAATLSLTACQAGSGTPGAKTPATGTASAASSAPAAPSASPRPAGATRSAPAAPVSPAAVSPVAATPSRATPATTSGSAPACTAKALEATAYQAADRPRGTGTGAAIVEFENVSATACALRGHPTVAGAGNGSPDHAVPLKVTRAGTASAVRLAPGGRAWVKLTFVQVQGEADGYCVSGATPAGYPTLVVGLPGAGSHQVALNDGVFAECDGKVTVTAVSSAKPS
ncbi:DUF4232 domain-containing protein [Streptomyces sp. NPDC015171]|uniref:DUF4232 domain-containing protein n=1 Tax=Streptomyces sp. NPDC015171 TaxID=3364945 RepID=UPI0036FE9CEF